MVQITIITPTLPRETGHQIMKVILEIFSGMFSRVMVTVIHQAAVPITILLPAAVRAVPDLLHPAAPMHL